VTKLPILRPLITYDKLDIIKIAKHIGSYPISILPFNDCCSVYVPKNPVTKPMEIYAKKYESLFEYEDLIYQLVRQAYTIKLSKDSKIDLPSYGFTLEEAMETYQKEREVS